MVSLKVLKSICLFTTINTQNIFVVSRGKREKESREGRGTYARDIGSRRRFYDSQPHQTECVRLRSISYNNACEFIDCLHNIDSLGYHSTL